MNLTRTALATRAAALAGYPQCSADRGGVDGGMTILVAYATQFGSTAGIAEAIGDAIRESGAAVDVRCVRDVQATAPYRAVVVGSAVHLGHLLPEAVDFVQRHKPHLDHVPVALFCVYISSPPQRTREAYLDDVRGLVQPVSEGFFTGRFDRRGAALLIPRVLAWLVPRIDRRSWREIRAWARSLVPLLRSADGS
jgi:menaquinone-dependent protoporphyrinogen oxidase